MEQLVARVFNRTSPGTAVVACFVALALLIAAFVTIFAGARDADQVAIEQSIVQAATRDVLVKLGDALRPNTYWDDGFDHITDRVDADWAAKNLGPYAQSTSNTSAVFIVAANDRIIYDYVGAKHDGDPRDLAGDSAFAALVANARAHPSAPPHIALGFVEVGGRIYLGAASLMVPNDDRAHLPLVRKNVEVYLQAFDGRSISKVQRDFHLSRVSLTTAPPPTGDAFVPLKDAAGERVGFLSWQAAKPGTAFAISVAPVALASFFLTGFVLLLALRNWSATVTKLEQDKLEAVQARSEQLRLGAAKAEEASAAKSTFLAMMSHEIRTPMNGVLGLTNVLLEDNLTPEQRAHLNTIRDSGESLLDIINDLLDFSKLEAGRIDLEEVAFDFDAMTCHAIEVIEPRASGKGVVLHFDIAESVPKYLRGDPGRIRQVVLNLLSNAVKFTDRGTVYLKVIGQPEGPSATRVRVEVTDTGIGIAPDQIGRLFETFSQADSSISRRFGGTGLGLAICKGIIERMGGKIGVHSKPGAGSTFWFELVLSIAQQSEANAERSRVPAEELERALGDIRALGRPYRLLVAEDNPTNQLVVKAMLAKHDIAPEFAGNGVEAINAVRAKTYDCVLMDLQMPEMGGLDAAQAIRFMTGVNGQVPIIALTANTQQKHVDACREPGMNGYLAKPFHKEDLLLALSAALHGVAWIDPGAAPGTTAAKPEAAGDVDWAALDAFRSNNGDDVYETLIETYIADAAQKLTRLAALMRENALGEEAERIAHSLKSASAMAGAPRLASLMAKLEAALADERPEDFAGEIAKAESLYAAYVAAIAAKAA